LSLRARCTPVAQLDQRIHDRGPLAGQVLRFDGELIKVDAGGQAK
jgi:hypothetical protein